MMGCSGGRGFFPMTTVLLLGAMMASMVVVGVTSWRYSVFVLGFSFLLAVCNSVGCYHFV